MSKCAGFIALPRALGARPKQGACAQKHGFAGGSELMNGPPASSSAAAPGLPTDASELRGAENGRRPAGGKERRQALGNAVVRNEIRVMHGEGKDGMNVVGDSDEDEEDFDDNDTNTKDRIAPDAEAFDAISHALVRNFIFKAIRTPVLNQVVSLMFKCQFDAGNTIIQQGDLPRPDDCLFFIQHGTVDLVIAGTSDITHEDDDVFHRENNKKIVKKGAGWLFGDLTLLFNTPRTASVIAFTNVTAWGMDRRTFMQLVMNHAGGARALRFVRKLPLMKGVSDNVLVSIAERLKEEVYSDGEYLIRAGDRADALYLIRYGSVKVCSRGTVLAELGRGQFVGERTLVTGKMRSADCVANGDVRAIVMLKQDFLETKNPLLDWMLPYDAAHAILKMQPEVKQLAPAKLEAIIDCFSPKAEEPKGAVLIKEGDVVDKLIVFITGEAELTCKGEPVDPATTDTKGFFDEAGGFSCYGLCCLSSCKPSPFTVSVKSKFAEMTILVRKDIDDIMGVAAGRVASLSASDKAFAKSVLQQSHVLSSLSEEQMAQLVDHVKVHLCTAGQIIVQMGAVANHVHILKHGECIVAQMHVNADTSMQQLRAVDHAFMCHGDFYGEIMLVKRQKYPASVVSVQQGTVILTLSIADVVEVLQVEDDAAASATLIKMLRQHTAKEKKSTKMGFDQLNFHRVVGTGQFGAVRLVTHKSTSEVFALKILHKAPITEGKQAEHIINELSVMEECKHPFCVQLKGAYQDQDCLYLLQEWVPGGELFHHLDVRGSFDEPTAQFYAATVLTALEYLHGKGIIYRDLKPENLLLDAQGYAKVADFGFAKHVGNSRTFTICGTPDYQAPEVIMRRGTTKAVDYWALGVLIFEMLVGDPPFMSTTGDPWDTFRRSMTGRCQVPSFVSEQAADLIYKLLQVNPDRRLGSNGAREIRHHPWFARMDWQMLAAKKLKAPIVPQLSSPVDTSNFESFESQVRPPPSNTRNDRSVWQLWEWVDTTGIPIHSK